MRQQQIAHSPPLDPRYAARMPIIASDMSADPFGERAPILTREPQQLLGARIEFQSNSRRLLRLVETAYAGLPGHQLSSEAPRLRVRLLLNADVPHPARSLPAPLAMLSGNGLLGGSTNSSNFVVMSPEERTALVVVSPHMLPFAYHTRYELIEFAVYTLAARVQRLIPLHAACVGLEGRGVVLMGTSGAGKSTVALHSLLAGFEFLSEDSVFLDPETMRATGIANFLHVRADSLRWLERTRDIAAIRSSPVITRRSGVKKFEVDLRRGRRGNGRYRLAHTAQKIVAIVYLSQEAAAQGELLLPLTKRNLASRLASDQRYAAGQSQWGAFKNSLSAVRGYELRRGRHPSEAVDALRQVIIDAAR